MCVYVDLVQSLGHDVLLDMSTHASNAVFLVMWPIFNVLLVNLVVAGLCPSLSPSLISRSLPISLSLSPSPSFLFLPLSLVPSLFPSLSLSTYTSGGGWGGRVCTRTHLGMDGVGGYVRGESDVGPAQPEPVGRALADPERTCVCVQGVGWGRVGDQQ